MSEAQLSCEELVRRTQWDIVEAKRMLVGLQKSIENSQAAIEETKRRIAESEALIAKIKGTLDGDPDRE
jgi:hypothetical protein